MEIKPINNQARLFGVNTDTIHAILKDFAMITGHNPQHLSDREAHLVLMAAFWAKQSGDTPVPSGDKAVTIIEAEPQDAGVSP